MNQKGLADLNTLLEGIATKIGDFTDAIKESTKKLDQFSKAIDSKILSLNNTVATLTTEIKEEDKFLSQNLHNLISDLGKEIRNFKDEVQISDIKEILASLQKLIVIPEKSVINKTVEKVIQEVYTIIQEIKGVK